MDWNRVEGNWKQLKGKVKEQWGRLTDDDLDVIAGKRDQLEGKIQERYGIEKDKVRSEVDAWYGRQTWHCAGGRRAVLERAGPAHGAGPFAWMRLDRWWQPVDSCSSSKRDA